MLFPSLKLKKSIQFLNPDDILREAEIREGDVVAELGCGAGHFVYEASRMAGPKGVVYAVDIQKPVLSHIKSKIKLRGFKNVKIILADLEKIGSTKIPNDSVDLAILTSTLHQAKSRKNMLIEAKRVLRPGGKLVIVEWKREGVPFGPALEIRIDEQKLKEAIKELGFRFVRNIKTDEYHYGFLVEK